MAAKSCGYMGIGHYCSDRVSFLLRYRDENQYCIGGERFSLFDDGRVRATCHEVTSDEKSKLALFLLDEYADYCKWHAEQHAKYGEQWPKLQSFERSLPWAFGGQNNGR